MCDISCRICPPDMAGATPTADVAYSCTLKSAFSWMVIPPMVIIGFDTHTDTNNIKVAYLAYLGYFTFFKGEDNSFVRIHIV